MVRNDFPRQKQTVQLPVIVADGLDVALYSSLRDAELHLEAVDVRKGSYIGYDAAGRLLDIKTVDDEVVITSAESNPTHEANLDQILRDSLQALGILKKPSATHSLAELIELASQSGLLYRPRL